MGWACRDGGMARAFGACATGGATGGARRGASYAIRGDAMMGGLRGGIARCLGALRDRGEFAVPPIGEKLFEKGEAAGKAVCEQEQPGRADAFMHRDDREAGPDKAEDGL